MTVFRFIDPNRMRPPVANELHTKPLTRKSQEESDWDRWTKYLHENDININPFDRLQWISDEGRYLALGLNDTGAKMNFNISDEIRSKLTRPITESSENRFGTAQFYISFISSGPGGGRTRLLLELRNLRPDLDALYFVTLNGLSALSSDDDVQTEDSTEISIAMRILYQAVQLVRIQKKKPLQGYRIWHDQILGANLKMNVTIREAITLLGGDIHKRCALVVDEVHKLEEGSQSPGNVALKNLVTVLGHAMLGTQIFSFMAGTLISAFGDYSITGGYLIDQIDLPLLSHAHQYAILDSIPQLAGWRCCPQVKELLLQLGGLPRLLEVFVRAITDRLNVTASFDDVSWKDVEMTTKGNEVAKSFGKGSSPELAQHLVDCIMLRKQVMPRWKVIPGSSETYEHLHQNSNIILQQSPDNWLDFCVTVPLLAFRNLVDTALRGPGDTDRFQKLCELLDMDASGWKTFEKFAITHTAIMNEFFKHDLAKDSFQLLPLSQRYAPGYGGAGKASIKLLATNVKVINCHQQFPKNSSIRPTKDGRRSDFANGNCYLNAAGASFADGFYVCHDDDDDERVDETMSDQTDLDASEDKGMDNGDMEDESGVDYPNQNDTGSLGIYQTPKLVVGELYKRWDTKKLQFETCIQEHENNKRAWKDAKVRTFRSLISPVKAKPEAHG